MPAAIESKPPAQQRRQRLHPCTSSLIYSGVLVGGAVFVATHGGSPILGLVLGLPSLALCLGFARRIVSGLPRTDPQAAERLRTALDEVGHSELLLGVTVQTQTASPSRLRRGPPPAIIAALDFVERSEPEVLRGVAAMHLSALADLKRAMAARRGWQILLLTVCLIALAAYVVAPPNVAVIAGLASLGLGVWVLNLVAGLISRTQRFMRRLHEHDLKAHRLAGDPRAVPQALRAMSAWRQRWRADRPWSARVIDRVVMPIGPDHHELTRASLLEEHRVGGSPDGRAVGSTGGQPRYA